MRLFLLFFFSIFLYAIKCNLYTTLYDTRDVQRHKGHVRECGTKPTACSSLSVAFGVFFKQTKRVLNATINMSVMLSGGHKMLKAERYDLHSPRIT